MRKIYFFEEGNMNKDLFKYLNNKYDFLSYGVNKYNKNIIFTLNELIKSLNEDDVILSDNLISYYLYFASKSVKNKVILINPYFFQKDGTLLTPSDDIISKNTNPNLDIIISEDNPNLKNLKKLFKYENREIIIVKSVIENIDKIMKNSKKKK